MAFEKCSKDSRILLPKSSIEPGLINARFTSAPVQPIMPLSKFNEVSCFEVCVWITEAWHVLFQLFYEWNSFFAM